MRNTDITAVCCTNDMVAAGALNAAHSMGCRIPEDLSVIGHDGSVYSEAVYPRLTTVSIRPVEIGKRAFAQALRLLEDPKAWDVDIVEPELLERDSVAMPSK